MKDARAVDHTEKVQFDNNYYDPPLVARNFLIYQIGDLYYKYGGRVDSHKQQYDLELSFVVKGEAGMSTDGEVTRVEKDCVYLSFRGDAHEIAGQGSFRFFYFAVNLMPSSPLFPILEFLKTNFAAPLDRKIHMPDLAQLFTNILYETATASDFSLEVIEANIIQILVTLYRIGQDIHSIGAYSMKLNEGLVYNIVNYIDKNFATITTLADFSEKFFYSYSYLTTIFKSVMNVSLKDYLQEKKLAYAKLLLEQTDKSITEISESLSYSSIHNFSRAYKNYYGISPSTYRRRLAEAAATGET